MATYTATISWSLKDGDDFSKGRFSRAHQWSFDGGHVTPGSPAPDVAPPPMSDPAGVDPEEAFVASLSSCHMLFFLYFAQRRGFVVQSYRDAAEGQLGKRADGRTAMARVALRPDIAFGGERAPNAAELADLHEKAHEACYIANSVTTEVVVEPPASA
ncbi:MAG: OsmC family protein [Caulobacterales bacterium]|nr:OsmC family protein [Caulobacterales bacterium]